MFRNPRENFTANIESAVKPSAGRPPTPPNVHRLAQPTTTMASPRAPAKPLTPRPSSKTNVSTSGRASAKKTPTMRTIGKPNSSILSYFKKVDSPLKDESIFLSQKTTTAEIPAIPRAPTPELDLKMDFDLNSNNDLYGYDGVEGLRFNEYEGSIKKRRTSIASSSSLSSVLSSAPSDLESPFDTEDVTGIKGNCSPPPRAEKKAARLLKKRAKKEKAKSKRKKITGPFIPDSDSDDEIYMPSHAKNQEAQDKAVEAEKRELRTRIANQPGEISNVVVTKYVKQNDIVENRPIVPELQSVNRILVLKSRTRIPIKEAQEKWEALQPNRKTAAKQTYSSPRKAPPNSFVDSQAAITKLSFEPLKSPHVDLNLESVILSPKTSKSSKEIYPLVPRLKKEDTSMDDWDEFEALPDDLDEFGDGDGEEFVERKWMEDQARLEAMVEDGEFDDGESFNGFEDDQVMEEVPVEEMAAACPICDASLGGITADEAARHVNNCLDGTPSELPKPKETKVAKIEPDKIKYMPPGASKRFQRAAVARPGQANPFEIGGKSEGNSSAFAKLMAGKAEDAAWQTAAAAEHSSRGKAAYQRVCPFYKIMPGFFICVDAFRYGAVKGCNAYFLSHFHSDHYIGLTSSWCHGPIYCSKVTANLVKQQLKVDPKYVVSLDFEQRFDVPGTQGVTVTMIPANHCPGSSLYLFEKAIGSGTSPKIQRVLHCGDFRACPAHIAHPKLMPDLVDSINGKTKQQKIDVCYLDTTYLNPRYAFPSQEDVIKACADMCVSLRKERAEDNDAWEKVKRERAGTGMQKFIQNPTLKAEDSSEAMAIGSSKQRGRLLVVCGTYSIGKERICMGIARALDCKIYAPNRKLRICAALEDPELMSRMTDDPYEAQIHMQMLMELRPETLNDYLTTYKPHFSRIVGFRPSGWNYKPPNSRFTDSPLVSTVLHSPNWRSTFSMTDLVPQRGSTKEASCFGVPYSEHSSFRELTMFVCALRIDKVIPTVNVGSAPGRAKMKAWIERWMAERRKSGVIKIGNGEGEVPW